MDDYEIRRAGILLDTLSGSINAYRKLSETSPTLALFGAWLILEMGQSRIASLRYRGIERHGGIEIPLNLEVPHD